MRDIKELLDILLTECKSKITNVYFFKNETSGFCEVTCSLKREFIITKNEEYRIDSFLKDRLLEDDYSHYPVTYEWCDYGTQDSYYFFKPGDW